MNKAQYLDLDGLKKYDELVKKYITSVHDALSGNIDSSLKGYVNEKVDEIKEKISDLDIIRSNAEKGSTAHQILYITLAVNNTKAISAADVANCKVEIL